MKTFWMTALGCSALVSHLWAQKPQVKTLEFKEAERKEEDLAVLKKEQKEFTPAGEVVRYVLFAANPIQELVKSLEVSKGTDAAGRWEETTKFDEGGEPILRERYYYSPTGQKLKLEFTDFLVNPDEKLTRTYEYSKTNKIIATHLTDSKGKKVGEESWKYNKEDEETRYNKWEMRPEGKYEEEKDIEYNPDGTLARSVVIMKDKGDELKEEIIFDRNKVKEKKRFKNGEVVSQFGGAGGKSTKYDPNKAKVLVDFGNDTGFGGMWDVQDEFDDKKRKIKTTKTEGVEVVEELFYEYDAKDNVIKTRKVSYAAGEPTGESEQRWEYDTHNNMLREASYTDGILMAEKTYAYQYY